jgi:hypothetical protein
MLDGTDGISVSDGSGAIVCTAHGLVQIQIPALGNDAIRELLKAVDSLPENFGLLVNRDTLRMEVFKIPNARRFDLDEGGIVERFTAQDMADNSGGKVLRAQHEKAEHHRVPAPSPGLLIIHI